MGERYDSRSFMSKHGTEDVTYRQFDYWVRTGIIRLSTPRPQGSGYYREITPAEQLTIIELARRKKELEAQLADLLDRDGHWFLAKVAEYEALLA